MIQEGPDQKVGASFSSPAGELTKAANRQDCFVSAGIMPPDLSSP